MFIFIVSVASCHHQFFTEHGPITLAYELRLVVHLSRRIPDHRNITLETLFLYPIRLTSMIVIS